MTMMTVTPVELSYVVGDFGGGGGAAVIGGGGEVVVTGDGGAPVAGGGGEVVVTGGDVGGAGMIMVSAEGTSLTDSTVNEGKKEAALFCMMMVVVTSTEF